MPTEMLLALSLSSAHTLFDIGHGTWNPKPGPHSFPGNSRQLNVSENRNFGSSARQKFINQNKGKVPPTNLFAIYV